MPVYGGVRLDGGPMFSEAETSQGASDVSSIVALSERLGPSDTEDDGDELVETEKYRMPDVGKTRLHLRTKEPLSPTPRPVAPPPREPRWPASSSTPATPRTATRHAYSGSLGQQSPGKMDLPMANGNSSAECVSDSDFVSSSLSRAGSIYSLSRVSFTGQLSQLTSMRLPDASSMARRISSIPTSKDAAKELSDASEQIRMWVGQASKVLSGLDAEDDVEWAAAGGRDGMEEADQAINRFDQLVQVYILSIERLQTREDIAELSVEELLSCVRQMEGIIASWEQVKQTMKGVKEQVELAMEWENLWNSVLGEIGQEMESLNRLVFEMEEKRHQGAEGLFGNRDSVDLNELETIVEERPGKGAARYSIGITLPVLPLNSPVQGPQAPEDKESSNLLALFARMQPLRASLDFLPMRLSVFHVRASPIFPTACQDLHQRRDQLEALWDKLDANANSLRSELGEDRWVLVFRNAGRQALKMCESVGRSYTKVKDSVNVGEHQTNPSAFATKMESYEAKKTHYGPAIERVLAIIDRGVQDRLTVNGEILRLQSEMKQRWVLLQNNMHDLDAKIEELTADGREKQLRDSVSTVMSSARSIASSIVDTPGSSPASSVVAMSRTNSFQGSRTPTPLTHAKIRQPSTGPSSCGKASARRPSSSTIPRRAPLTRDGDSELRSSPSPSPAVPRGGSAKPETPGGKKPKWVSVVKPQRRDFLPLSAFEPSPYARQPITPKSNFLRASAKPGDTPTSAPARVQTGRNLSTPSSSSKAATSATPDPPRRSFLPVPKITATPASGGRSALMPKTSLPALRSSSFRGPSNTRQSSLLDVPSSTSDGNEADSESPSLCKTRPRSALASGRRSSMLNAGARSRLQERSTDTRDNDRPRWRH